LALISKKERILKTLLPVLALAALLSACNANAPSDTPEGAPPPDTHTSRNSLDWQGTYQGVLPCADCPGIRTVLTLRADNTYQLQTQYLERQPRPDTVQGRFGWLTGDNAIELDSAGDHYRYQVGENRLTMMSQDGTLPSGPLAEHYVLKRSQ